MQILSVVLLGRGSKLGSFPDILMLSFTLGALDSSWVR